jgi:hypothetical protein
MDNNNAMLSPAIKYSVPTYRGFIPTATNTPVGLQAA